LAAAVPAYSQGYAEWSTPNNIGQVVNSAWTDGCPAISRDGLSLYFASDRPGGYGLRDIYVSRRPSGDSAWGAPENLGPGVNGPGDDICPTPMPNGRELYFVSNGSGGCGGYDLYVVWRRDRQESGGWQDSENLGCGVNSSANEIGPSIYEDENTGAPVLYFSSNRGGGLGGMDIYASTMGEDGIFGPAQLVPELSTPQNDQQPSIRKDGLEIFFASNRPGSLGSFDIWTATRASTSELWVVPVNLGSGVNTPASEVRPFLRWHGTELYFDVQPPGQHVRRKWPPVLGCVCDRAREDKREPVELPVLPGNAGRLIAHST
jgi:Tol biopolymer transport system component